MRARWTLPAAALVAASLFLGFVLKGQASEPARVSWPEGYRQWTHVKSMVIRPGHELYDSFGGIHHVYANPAALKALREGGEFPDGAVLVFDLLEAVKGGNAITEGDRKVVGVMERDRARFASTGGWGFEGFAGKTRERVVKDPAGECFGCHKANAAPDYVFSTYRD